MRVKVLLVFFFGNFISKTYNNLLVLYILNSCLIYDYKVDATAFSIVNETYLYTHLLNFFCLSPLRWEIHECRKVVFSARIVPFIKWSSLQRIRERETPLSFRYTLKKNANMYNHSELVFREFIDTLKPIINVHTGRNVWFLLQCLSFAASSRSGITIENLKIKSLLQLIIVHRVKININGFVSHGNPSF